MKALKVIISSLLAVLAVYLYFSEPDNPEPSALAIAVPKVIAFACAFVAFRIHEGIWPIRFKSKYSSD